MSKLPNRAIVALAQPFRPLYIDAYDALRDAILNGRLGPGDRIVEAEVARQMAISRAPIREAIRKLEQDGLVRYVPRRGTVVVKLSSDEVRDVYYLRAHLEGYAARLATRYASEADLQALAGLFDQMMLRADSGDLPGLIAADVEFHGMICQVSGSKRLPILWESLNPQSWTIVTGHKAAGFSLRQIAERHQVILDALQARDADRAEEAIRRHITDLADNVLVHLDDTRGAANGGRQPSDRAASPSASPEINGIVESQSREDVK